MGRTRLRYTSIGIFIVLLAAGAAWAGPIDFAMGTYVLGNHPGGNAAPPGYGLRLDNLFGGVSPFTFDFECDECLVLMDYDGTTIDISGTAYGGHPDGDGGYEDDMFDGLYGIDVSYDMSDVTENFGDGDDDGLQDIGHIDDTGAAIGTLEFLSPTMLGEDLPDVTKWDLMDKSGSHFFSIRVGDEDDDDGHRGFDGISGWGWLKFREHGTDDPFVDARGAQDFFFTAERVPVPVPTTVSLLIVGLVAFGVRRRKNR